MFKILTKGCEPTRNKRFSAGIDLYSSKDIVIGAGETAVIGLGVCIDTDELNYTVDNYFLSQRKDVFKHREKFLKSHYLELHPQNSLMAKGLISNTGIIDLDYEDEIKIIIHNSLKLKWWNEKNEDYLFPKVHSDTIYKIKKGDKVAQVLLKEHKGYLFEVESDG